MLQSQESSEHGGDGGDGSSEAFVNSYLKKHKLDVTLLPNKKIIKLSDWRASLQTRVAPVVSSQPQLSPPPPTPPPTTTPTTTTTFSYITLTPLAPADIGETQHEESLDESNCDMTSVDYSSESSSHADADETEETEEAKKKPKKARKKREPSLKLKQKLSNQDLELIVQCIKAGQAQVFIADVQKDNYVDKILRVQLVSTAATLSNGRAEALLKKSMFSKELAALFDTFVNALCTQVHVVNEHGQSKPTLSCQVVDCGFRSLSEAEMMRHIKRHLAQDGYTCGVCSNQFASMTNLQRHLRIHNGNMGKELKCQHCDYRASTVTHIKRHMAHKHLERSLPCPHCTFMGATNAELKIHMARKHLELTGKNPLFLPNYLRKDYECNLCTMQFTDFKEYQAHMYRHSSSSNRFQCVECPYNCKNFSKLKRHMLYHAGARNFSCELCGNKFYQMEHLKRHMQSIHHQTSPSLASSSKPASEAETSAASDQSAGQSDGGKESKSAETTTDPTPPIPTVEQQQQLAAQPSYIVTSKCTYKCQKCDYTTSNLYTLNEHAITRHVDETTSQMGVGEQRSGGGEAYSELDDEFDEPENEPENNDEDEEDEEGDDEYDDFDEILNEMEFNVYPADLEARPSSGAARQQLRSQGAHTDAIPGGSFRCSFCSYRSAKKASLKTHLRVKHASQTTAPIFLSNDEIMNHPNTKFQCVTCRQFLPNLGEYVVHMSDKHKVKVVMVEPSSQPVPSETSAESSLAPKEPARPEQELVPSVSADTGPMMMASANPQAIQPSQPFQQLVSSRDQQAGKRQARSSSGCGGAKSKQAVLKNTSIPSYPYKIRTNRSLASQPVNVRINPLLLKHQNISIYKKGSQHSSSHHAHTAVTLAPLPAQMVAFQNAASQLSQTATFHASHDHEAVSSNQHQQHQQQQLIEALYYDSEGNCHAGDIQLIVSQADVDQSTIDELGQTLVNLNERTITLDASLTTHQIVEAIENELKQQSHH